MARPTAPAPKATWSGARFAGRGTGEQFGWGLDRVLDGLVAWRSVK